MLILNHQKRKMMIMPKKGSEIRLPFLNSIKITAGPAVFECGDCYAVIWATNAKGSGCVEVNGKTYWDTRSGLIKTHDRIHTVKIPKEELIGKEYRVYSQRINYKLAYSAFKGDSFESRPIKFKGTPSDTDINLLCISDVHNMAEKMYKSLEYHKENPDIIFMLGDISSVLEFKKTFIEGIIEPAGKISKGEIPVVYARGNHETRGEFASQLINYFPTATKEFYFTFDFGQFSAVVLDPGEDKKDTHIEYSGLVDFESYRQQQYNWICNLNKNDFKGKYLITFSHEPVLNSHFGKDWTNELKKLGVDLIVGGHHHKSEFINGEPPVYDICGKRAKTDDYACAMLTLCDNKISMKTVTDKGEIILEKTISI